ncbi:MAG TPA: DUF4292 domain-containing protein [Aquaticitalea sp.]|nr:DUF4292 domain-containing protein [Aquaticitalea sp.]HNU58745.1 DUF4292 domain-containing protein [Aquaticitalea sp.]
MNHLKFICLTVIFVALYGCKTSKSLTGTAPIKETITARQLIKENNKQAPDFKTLQAKVKIDYTEGKRSNGFSVTLRMEKDKAIWLNATLDLVRAYITPESVKYYSKLDNEYFDGDYSLLSKVLGIDLDFYKLQNLLLGEMIFAPVEDTYAVSFGETSYILSPKEQSASIEIFYLLNPSHFKLDSQQLYQSIKKRFLQVDYKLYQKVDREIIPENIHIVAVEDNSEVIIDLEYKSLKLNEQLRFPFKIPSGYKEIEIE